MATYITAEPEVGELRYIARLSSSVLPSEYPFGDVSTTAGSTETIEGSDVFVVDGETRSKFYSSQRFIDDHVHCVYGDDVHACFVKPQYETSSGGPFFRDINSNNGGSEYTSLTFYMNSGHVQTEDRRMGLNGPYALTFSRSGIPKLADFDFSFFNDLDIEGYVPASGRGYVSGTASGIEGDFQIVVHWYNADAQYWTYASSAGAFTSPAMKPGTYTMKLYRTELEVASQSVKVSAGSTTTSNIASALEEPSESIWTIGTCDGQPTGFRNAEHQLRMHPSDSRMEEWAPGTFAVGTSVNTDMPMALFKSVNSPQTITFDSDSTAAATLRIRTTLAFASGRPSVTIGSWSDSAAAPTKIDSRGVTRGAYRGYGEAYEFDIPEGTLVTGSNTLEISVISGSSGNEFLSPNFVSAYNLTRFGSCLTLLHRFSTASSCTDEPTVYSTLPSLRTYVNVATAVYKKLLSTNQDLIPERHHKSSAGFQVLLTLQRRPRTSICCRFAAQVSQYYRIAKFQDTSLSDSMGIPYSKQINAAFDQGQSRLALCTTRKADERHSHTSRRRRFRSPPNHPQHHFPPR